ALVAEEVVAHQLLLVVDVLGAPVAEDHLVDPLERGARHPRVLPDQCEVVLEAPFPVQLRVLLAVLEAGDTADPRRLSHVVLHPFSGTLVRGPEFCSTFPTPARDWTARRGSGC